MQNKLLRLIFPYTILIMEQYAIQKLYKIQLKLFFLFNQQTIIVREQLESFCNPSFTIRFIFFLLFIWCRVVISVFWLHVIVVNSTNYRILSVNKMTMLKTRDCYFRKCTFPKRTRSAKTTHKPAKLFNINSYIYN